jgi:PAS domain S-box-containing protein
MISIPPLSIKKLIAELSEAIIIIDTKHRISFLNKGAEKLFGIESKGMLEKPITTIFPSIPEHLSLTELIEWSHQHEEIIGKPFQRPDIFLETAWNYLQTGDSELALLYVRDITNQRSQESEAQWNRELMKTLLDLANDFVKAGIAEIETTIITTLLRISEYIHVDRSYVYTTNTDHQSMSCLYEWCQRGNIPRNSYELQIPWRMLPWLMEQLEQHFDIHLNSLDDLPQAAREERAFLLKSNVKSWIMLPMVSVKTLRGFIGFEMLSEAKTFPPSTIDILRFLAELYASALERKRTVDQLRRNQAVHTALISAIPDTVMQFDPAGVLRSFTIGDEQHFFLSDDFIGKNLEDFLPVELIGIFSNGIRKALVERTITTHIFTINFADGKQTYEARFVVSVDQEIIVILRNISEQSFRDQLKLDFLLGVAHEMKTPLNTALLVLDALEESDKDNEASKNLKIIRKQLQRQENLMHEILDISKLESAPLTQERKPFDIITVINQSMNDVRSSAEIKNVQIKTDFGSTIPFLIGDSASVALVMNNLLTNAIKYSKDPSEIKIKVRIVTNEICISVIDSGCGISNDELSRILRGPDFVSTSSTPKPSRSGFGLHIVRTVVDNMGGRLEVESVINKGSTFRIFLPINSDFSAPFLPQ